MSFGVALTDGASPRLAEAVEAVDANLLSVAEVLQQELLARVEAKVAGGVLAVRSGRLLASLHASVRQDENGFVAEVGAEAPEARPLEYGGLRPARDILPTVAQALHFGGGAGAVYAAVVHMPETRLKPHSFLRAALAEMDDEIATDLGDASVSTLRGLVG